MNTGELWGGFPIMAKVVNAVWPSSDTWGTTAHGISTDDYGYFDIIRLDGYAGTNNPYFMPLNYYDGSSRIAVYANRTNLVYRTNYSNIFGRDFDVLIYFISRKH